MLKCSNTYVDGFGAVGRPWGEVGLPFTAAGYWTGTVNSDAPDGSWMIFPGGNVVYVVVYVSGGLQSRLSHVVCVP